jgi:hypothetical protein
MKRTAFFTSIFVFSLVTGGVFAKVTQPKPRYNRAQTPSEKACVESKVAFKHTLHTSLGLSCNGCHELITKENLEKGETIGEIRRPDHGDCISCHGENKTGGSYFFEPDDAKRTICASCHTPRKESNGKPVDGSENDPIARPDILDYSNPQEKPCNPTYGFEFSHYSHASQGCIDCHSVNEMTVKGPSHATCFRCHDKGNNAKAAAVANPETCKTCHPFEGKESAKLSYLSGGREDFFSQYSHQTHIKRIETASPDKKPVAICESCHNIDASFSLMQDQNLHPGKDKQLTGACFCCHYEGSTKGFSSKSNCTMCHEKLSGIPVAPASHDAGSCSFK